MPEFAIGQKDTNKKVIITITGKNAYFSTLSLLHPKLGSRSPCTKKARTLFSFPSALKQQAKGREDF